MDDLNSQLGITELSSSVAELKSLLMESSHRRRAELLSHDSPKRPKVADHERRGRTTEVESEFDPSGPLDSLLPLESSEDFSLPSVFDESDVYGPKVSQTIASRVQEACTKKAIDSKLKDLENKYHTQENCSFLCVPKVNLELWYDLVRPARTKDLALKEVQRGVVKGTQPVTDLLNKVLEARKQRVQLDPAEFLSPLADAMTFLCHSSYKISMSRRELLRDNINLSYCSVCSQSTPVGKWLFRDELPKQIKDIAEVNKLATKLGSTHQRSSLSGKIRERFHPKHSQGGNKPYFLSYGNLPQGQSSYWKTEGKFPEQQSRPVTSTSTTK